MTALTMTVLALLLPTVPGKLNPSVTPATINVTICVKGWTSTIRPPVSYTNALKHQLLTSEHLPGAVSDYELDHFWSLELGGAPKDPANLWMEPIVQARVSDPWENRWHRRVCSGSWGLNYARRVEARFKRAHG